MTHTCRNCKRIFSSKLQYELHRDRCSADALICEECGEQFSKRQATKDGWHYACPTEECTGSGLEEDLHPVRDFSVAGRAQ